MRYHRLSDSCHTCLLTPHLRCNGGWFWGGMLAANRLLWWVMDFVVLVGDNCGKLFNISGLATWKFQKTWHGNRQNSLQNLGHVGHIYSQLPFSYSSSACSTIGEELASNLCKFHIIATTWTLCKFLKSGPEQIPLIQPRASRAYLLHALEASFQFSWTSFLVIASNQPTTPKTIRETEQPVMSLHIILCVMRHCGMRLQSGDRHQAVERQILGTCFYSRRRAFDIVRHHSTSFDIVRLQYLQSKRNKTSKFRMDVSALRISP